MIVYPKFAYSAAMQIILFLISSISIFFSFTYITNLIAIVFGEKISLKRKVLFVLVVGLFLNRFWIYAVYIIGGFKNFSPIVYDLVATSNPVFALLYYLCGVKILKLPKYRSIHLMRMVYLYIIFKRILSDVVKCFFPQNGERYNYILDAIFVLVCLTIYTLVYFGVKFLLLNPKLHIRLKDSPPVQNLFLELLLSFIYAACVYAAIIIVPFFIYPRIVAFSSLLIFLALCLLQNTIFYSNRVLKNELENKDVNLRVLTNAIDDFSGLKHDFYNILQTYEGYIAIADLDKLKTYHQKLLNTTSFVGEQLDLTPQMSQNPALTSLLIDKMHRASEFSVKLSVNILCDINSLYIPNEDICYALSALLDTAIESAAKSEDKHISFSAEKKNSANKLLIINSSILCDVAKATSENILSPKNFADNYIFAKIRKVFYRYSNVFFHLSINPNDFSIYIELSPQK